MGSRAESAAYRYGCSIRWGRSGTQVDSCRPDAVIDREPKTLWSVRANGRRTDCVIVGVGELGWEGRLLSDGSEFYARRWTLRAEALDEADTLRLEFEVRTQRATRLLD